MHKAAYLLASVLIAISGIFFAGCGESYPEIPVEGEPARDFILANQDGKPVSLKDYRGQWIVLYFYARDYGKQSTADMRSFQKNQSRLEELHTVVLGISPDNFEKHKAFATQEHLPFTLLADEEQKVARLYGSFHRTHLIHHVIVYSAFIVDPNGKIARVFFDFGPADPGGEMIDAIGALERQ